MVMADDALSTGEELWGGPREKKWEKSGKRAVIMIDGPLYALVGTLARLCRRPIKSFNQQVYAAGIQALTGISVEDLTTRSFTVSLKGSREVVIKDDEVRAMCRKALTLDGDDR